MARRFSLLATTAATLVACTQEIRVVAPPNVGYVALVAFEGGTLAHTTPLMRLEDPRARAFTDSVDMTATVLGFDDAVVRESAPSEAEIESTDPLRRRDPCEPELPPVWAAARDPEGDIAVVDPASLPSFADPWADQQCVPEPERRIAIDFPCEPARCEPVIKADSCRIRVEPSSDRTTCAFEPFEVLVQKSGAVCALSRPKPECDVLERAADGAALSFNCNARTKACGPDVYRLSDSTPPFLTAERTFSKTVAEPPREDADPTSENLRWLRTGYFADFAFPGRGTDRIAVLWHQGRWIRQGCAPSSGPSEILVLETDRGAEVGSATAAPCLHTLVADPIDGGYLAFGSGRPFAARLDRSGATRLARQIDTRDERLYEPVDAVVSPAEGRVVVLLRETAPGKITTIVSIDLTTLETRAVQTSLTDHAITVRDSWSMALAPNGAVLVARAPGDVRSFDAKLEAEPLAINADGPRDPRFVHVAVHPSSRIVLASVAHGGAIFLLPTRLTSQRAFLYERAALPVLTAVWPNGSAHPPMLVAAMEPESTDTWLALVDLDARRPDLAPDVEVPRFRPGAVKVGKGTVRRSLQDDGGGIWLLYPWSAEVWRVRSR